MSPASHFQAVILAGGGGNHLFPLNATGPKVLLPVANRPLLTFPLRSLEEAGITDILVVCEGDAAASAVRSWVNQHASGEATGIEVLRVAEGLPSVAALRQVMDRIRSSNVIVLSGDVVTELPLRAQLLQHQLRGATVTALFGRRKTSAAADTQPGKPPRNVDYVGISDGDRLTYFSHSPETVKEVVLPPGAVRRYQSLSVTTKLVDMQVYVFKTHVLKEVLEENPELLKLEDHLMPYLAKRQGPLGKNQGAAAGAQHTSSNSLTSSEMSGLGHAQSALSLMNLSDAGDGSGPVGSGHEGMSHGEWMCTAYIAPEGSYCLRANTLQGFADVNRDAVTPELAPKLLRETPSARGENFIAQGVTLGTKATVGGGCMIGADSVLGDKCSVKRSVIGRGCTFGANCKVINSVLMDGVQVADNCHIQNSVVSAGCVLQTGSQLKDTQVGPRYVVAAGSDHKGEVLSDAKK